VGVQTVTYACVPLRAEFTIDGETYVRGLYIEPDCPSPDAGLADCYQPPAGHPQCPFSCPELTEWKSDPPKGGTAPMHVFGFPVADDGTQSGSLTVVVHLTLSTLDGTLIWDGDESEDLAPLADHRAGYFHSGLIEFNLVAPVFDALGRNCL
jgi:hypothetical protein